MRVLTGLLLVAGLLTAAAVVSAQQGDKKKGDKSDKGDKAAKSDKSGVDAFVAKFMAFNKKKDGKLTREELTDERLHRLFDRADANKDGVVTKEELAALYEKEIGQGGDRGGP